MIEYLTDEQEKMLNTIAEEYEKNVLGGDNSYNIDEIKKGIDFLYSLIDLPGPGIVICESPFKMVIEAQLKPYEKFDYLGCGYDSGWTSFYDCMEQFGVKYDEEFNFDKWRNFIKKSGVFATVLFEKCAFICLRPCAVHRDDNFNLHNLSGLAIEWSDGTGLYSIHGVIVPGKIVMAPETIEIDEIQKEKNIEVQRVMIEQLGVDKYLNAINAEIVDVDMRGIEGGGARCLIKDNLGNKWLIATDGSTSRIYYLSAPKESVTCKQAHESLSGFNENLIKMEG